MALRPVSAAEIESLAIGAWILGTGGGGSPYLALLNMRQLYRRGTAVSLLDPMDLADDARVAVVSNMGAPLVGLFFFQAEDGIRDGTVTGVQTCALPIYLSSGILIKNNHIVLGGGLKAT